jgi:hypothetical protein
MINYTERIALLIGDIVRRSPSFSFINPAEILVFGRFGRADTGGPFATCHCLTLPTSDPGYFFWKDRATGELTRQTEWFVTKSPTVHVGRTRIKYLISFVLPRFCNQSLAHSRTKADRYPNAPAWVGKLDTIVHELYHIDPGQAGLRRLKCAGGNESERSHVPHFYQDVARLVNAYLEAGPDPALLGFLAYDFDALTDRFGGILGTTFTNFPSYPQRYRETLPLPASDPLVRVDRIKRANQPELYTERDLQIRQFTVVNARRVPRKRQHRAA